MKQKKIIIKFNNRKERELLTSAMCCSVESMTIA